MEISEVLIDELHNGKDKAIFQKVNEIDLEARIDNTQVKKKQKKYVYMRSWPVVMRNHSIDEN